MIVTRGYSTDPSRNVLDPLLEKRWSFFFELRGGDVIRPASGGNWLKPPYPTKVYRWFCKRNILPFLSWRFGSRGGYIGFKAFPANADEYPMYLEWMAGPEDLQPGSQALSPSIRPFANMEEQ